MGLWQEVILSSSGPVTVRHATVETKLNLPKADFTHLTVRAEVRNATAAPVKGTLRGSIEGQGGPIEFSQPVELTANEKKEIVFSPESDRATQSL